MTATAKIRTKAIETGSVLSLSETIRLISYLSIECPTTESSPNKEGDELHDSESAIRSREKVKTEYGLRSRPLSAEC